MKKSLFGGVRAEMRLYSNIIMRFLKLSSTN